MSAEAVRVSSGDKRLPEVNILKMGNSLFINDQKTEANLLKNLGRFSVGGQLRLQLLKWRLFIKTQILCSNFLSKRQI